MKSSDHYISQLKFGSIYRTLGNVHRIRIKEDESYFIPKNELIMYIGNNTFRPDPAVKFFCIPSEKIILGSPNEFRLTTDGLMLATIVLCEDKP